MQNQFHLPELELFWHTDVPTWWRHELIYILGYIHYKILCISRMQLMHTGG